MLKTTILQDYTIERRAQKGFLPPLKLVLPPRGLKPKIYSMWIKKEWYSNEWPIFGSYFAA